jgi:hypothetical protein
MHGMHQDAVDPMQRTDRGRKTSFISRSGANKVVLASRSGQSQWGVSWRSFHERKRGVNVNRNHSPQHLGFYTNHCDTNDLNAAQKPDRLVVANHCVEHMLPHVATFTLLHSHVLHTLYKYNLCA